MSSGTPQFWNQFASLASNPQPAPATFQMTKGWWIAVGVVLMLVLASSKSFAPLAVAFLAFAIFVQLLDLTKGIPAT